MKVSELIEILKSCNPDYAVTLLVGDDYADDFAVKVTPDQETVYIEEA